VVALVAGLGAVGAVEPAGAAVTSFKMSPTAGPPGTVVHVRGNGCAPGVLGSRDANFVAVTVTTLGISFRAPVAANGSWSGTFTIPESGAGLRASSAPVSAGCVSSNVLSLTTVYPLQVFRLTAAPVTTQPGTPTTGEPVPGNVYLPGDPATVISVPTESGKPTAAMTDAARLGRRGSHATTSTAPAGARGRDAEPATLRPAAVDARSAAGTGAGLGWLGWVLLLLVVLAALGATGYFWRTRHGRDAMPGASA
jgi:hypothetical protein